MAGLVSAIPALLDHAAAKAWMPGTRPGMTHQSTQLPRQGPQKRLIHLQRPTALQIGWRTRVRHPAAGWCGKARSPTRRADCYLEPLPVVALGAGADEPADFWTVPPTCGSGPGALRTASTKMTTNTTAMPAAHFAHGRTGPSRR